MSESARAWEETIVLPTYPVGEAEPNPMFLEKRVYQGSSGAVYPFPVIDKIVDEKRDQEWRAVFLENAYIKVMLLPQLGGRVQMLLDKTNNYHAVYYQHVIKPALVGLCGPWISGGIEFNWPQHHRPTTFMPIDHRIVENPDGSKTVWMHETDRMHGTRSLMGFTIHPDKAYLEIKVKLYNGTPLPQTFLWWANPACHVDENHQSVFPPDVHAVMDHGKRDVSTFPIANGTYYKVDYSPGTDISRYRNIPVPTSYMAYHSDFNFVASYDHGKRAGLLHVANHHVSPGKKQWTWGNGDFGKAWDRQLTDSDGPYIELMCGVFTDNQPDFSWLNPYEEKSFTQYFMPYKHVGRIKNASTEGAINLEVENGKAYVAAYVTEPRRGVCVRLTDGSGKTIFEQRIDLTPEKAFETSVSVTTDTLTLSLLDASGKRILSYTPAKVNSPIPKPAEPALPPELVATTEQLYLTGLHLEQYRHATWEPEPYYREALRRDPRDARNNNALGLLLYRCGKFSEAEAYFRAALKTLTARNPNPYDGEPYYNLGLALRMQGKLDEAFDAFYKSVWNAAMRMQGYFQLAQIASIRGKYVEAIELCDQSLIGNWHHHKARFLKAALLRKLGRVQEAEKEDAVTRSIDPMYGSIRQGELQDRIELALDFINAGLVEAGVEVLLRDTGFQPVHRVSESQNLSSPDVSGHGLKARVTAEASPILLYLAGWALQSRELFDQASKSSPRLCFPHRLEELLALREAVRVNPKDGTAWYLLGNLLFSKRVYDEAIGAWEKAVELLPALATAHRNLALAYYNKKRDPEAALRILQKAFELDHSDARVLFELDQLFKKINHPVKQRLEFLNRYPELVKFRDDLFIEHSNLQNLLGEFVKVQSDLAGRNFHPWEGGEGKVTGAYVTSLLGIAREHLSKKEFEMALSAIDRARVYPHNLGEGKLPGAMENDLDYFAGVALEGMGRADEARNCFERASSGLEEPVSAMFYNDQPPHTIFYQGLACRKLGREGDARRKFQKLVDYGTQHLNDHVTIDYFAVSLPEFLVFEDDLDHRNVIHCRYMMGLGWMGLGKLHEAKRELEHVVGMDLSHLGASVHLRLFESSVWK